MVESAKYKYIMAKETGRGTKTSQYRGDPADHGNDRVELGSMAYRRLFPIS